MRLLVAFLVIGLMATPAAAQNTTPPADDVEDEDMEPLMISVIVLAAFVLLAFLLARYGP